jgi:hypothetical protein
MDPEQSVGLGVRYTLQSSLIHGVPEPATPDSPWQVTQVWHGSAAGMVGLIAIQATAEVQAAAVVGRIGLGPGPVQPLGQSTWACGPLRVCLLEPLGHASVGPVLRFVDTEKSAWPGLILRQDLAGPVATGTRFVYAVWVGPAQSAPPTSLDILPHDNGWVAHWADGATVATLFNPDTTPTTLDLVWPSSAPHAWTTDAGREVPLTGALGRIQVEVGGRACVIVE